VAFYAWFRDNPAEHPGINAAERALIDGGRHRRRPRTRCRSPGERYSAIATFGSWACCKPARRSCPTCTRLVSDLSERTDRLAGSRRSCCRA
jgi:hypothetical protein